jgi:hypothetical protein
VVRIHWGAETMPDWRSETGSRNLLLRKAVFGPAWCPRKARYCWSAGTIFWMAWRAAEAAPFWAYWLANTNGTLMVMASLECGNCQLRTRAEMQRASPG